MRARRRCVDGRPRGVAVFLGAQIFEVMDNWTRSALKARKAACKVFSCAGWPGLGTEKSNKVRCLAVSFFHLLEAVPPKPRGVEPPSLLHSASDIAPRHTRLIAPRRTRSRCRMARASLVESWSKPRRKAGDGR